MPNTFDRNLGVYVRKQQLLQIINAWEGSPNAGVPLNLTRVSSDTAPAATFRNLGNGGGLRVISKAGATLFQVDENGTTLALSGGTVDSPGLTLAVNGVADPDTGAFKPDFDRIGWSFGGVKLIDWRAGNLEFLNRVNITSGGLRLVGNLDLTGQASTKIIAGSTDVTVRNSLDTLSNLVIAEAGDVAVRRNLSIGGTFTANGQTYTFPASQNGVQYLQTNGAGVLSWGTVDTSIANNSITPSKLSQGSLVGHYGAGTATYAYSSGLLSTVTWTGGPLAGYRVVYGYNGSQQLTSAQLQVTAGAVPVATVVYTYNGDGTVATETHS